MKTKTFDCVDMKRRGADRVQRDVANMSPEEELDFWRKQTERLRRRQSEQRDKHRPSDT